jgi:hypothetical protein
VSLFDTYVPTTPLPCPVCGTRLERWQGKDGPNALFTWRQGDAAPVDQDVDADVALHADGRARCRLPDRFTIYSYDCNQHRPVEAQCGCVEGVWVRTVVVPFSRL